MEPPQDEMHAMTSEHKTADLEMVHNLTLGAKIALKLGSNETRTLVVILQNQSFNLSLEFIIIHGYLADTFSQSHYQLIRLGSGQSSLEQLRVKGLI